MRENDCQTARTRLTLHQVLVEENGVVLISSAVAGRTLEIENLLQLPAVEKVLFESRERDEPSVENLGGHPEAKRSQKFYLHDEEIQILVFLAKADPVDAKNLGKYRWLLRAPRLRVR